MAGGQRLAALRAYTAASHVQNEGCSQKAAAKACGSNPLYVAAMLALLGSEKWSLVHKVLTGEVPLLAAARKVGKLAAAVSAYKAMSAADQKTFTTLTDTTPTNLTDHLVHSNPSERAAAARALGADVVWDEMVLPLIREDRQSAPAE
jgi:hypothetical protein